MRAYTHLFREGLTKGLRRSSTNPRNSQALIECHNVVPSEQGLKNFRELSQASISGGGGTWDTVSFPWPQIVFLERYTLGFAKVGDGVGWFELEKSGENWAATLMNTFQFEPTQIEISESGTFYVLAVHNETSTESFMRTPYYVGMVII